jgi:transposase InsO family protein
MKRFFVVLAVVAPMFLVACASHANKAAGGPNEPENVTANGYTKEGCLLNLKITARERNVRLVPDEFQMEANWFIFLFPFLNHEGYRCSANIIEREKRPWSKDPLYPVE